MWYNLKNPLEIDKFRDRVTELRNKGAVVELTEKRARSLQANKYLHLMLSKFALEYGYTLDEVKTHFYKVTVNPTYISGSEWISLVERYTNMYALPLSLHRMR